MSKSVNVMVSNYSHTALLIMYATVTELMEGGVCPSLDICMFGCVRPKSSRMIKNCFALQHATNCMKWTRFFAGLLKNQKWRIIPC
jgi:hypothetical protein